MRWLVRSRIYKPWAVNMDNENAVVINPKEEIQTEPEPNDAPADMSGVEADIEAMVKSSEEKARSSARGIVDNATIEAGKILTTAREEAARLKKEAEESIEKERAKVLLDAEKKGYEDGYQKGSKEAEGIINEANNLKTETSNEREAAISRLEPDLVELIIRIVKKLISDTVKINPQVVLYLIRQGLAQSNFTGDVTLRVSKDDYDSVIANKDTLLEFVEGGANLEVIKDFSLGAGDCLIETPFGVIDSSLDMQYEEVRESLRLILEGESDGVV